MTNLFPEPYASAPGSQPSAKVVKADDHSVTMEMQSGSNLPKTIVVLDEDSKDQLATYTLDEGADNDLNRGGIR